MIIRQRKSLFMASAMMLPILSMMPATAHAADADAPAATSGPEAGFGEILVTARKRKESALDVPVALNAYSAETLTARNVQTVEELTAITPGMNLNNSITGSARSDRSQTALIIRGMAPSRGNRTSSTFINGVAVSDGTVTGIFDIASAEILKGPQSAYFGRQTFAGAINFVTAEPTDEWKGAFSALGGSRSYVDLRGAVGGPIIPGILSFRASGRYFSRDGSWKNAAEPGNTLGEQSTRSGTLALKFTPTDNLTVKLLGMVANDDDGAGATGVILPSQSNCVINGNPYFCGTLPGLAAGQPSARTEVTPGVAAMFDEYSPLFSKDENIDHFGMKRDSNHFSATVDYETDGGVTLSSLTGVNRTSWTVLYNLNGRASPYLNTYTTGPEALEYTDWPLMIQHEQKDFSQEFRVSSPQDGPFRWMFGGSYLWAKGYESYAQLYFFSGLSSAFSSINENKTWGGFVGLSYDLSDQFTINFDGRYQSDKIISYTAAGDVGYQKTYKNFMPRITAQYKPSRDMMFYATYSRGVNPGLGIDPLLSVPTEYQSALEAQGVTHGVKPEILDNFEAGVKGSLFNNRLTISADIYYDIWKDKIVEQTLLLQRENDTPLFVSVFTNLGKVALKGFELDMTARPVDDLTLTLAGAINDSEIKSGVCSTCSTLSGNSDVRGNRLPFTSKYSVDASGEYSHDIAVLDGFKGYVRSEFTWKSGVYESEGNYAKTKAATNVNFRLGVRSKTINVEGFVTNAFNNKTYTSVQPNWDISNPAEDFGAHKTMYVGLPQLRTWGLRVGYNF
jgi:iron complex outermembrane receptor protein